MADNLPITTAERFAREAIALAVQNVKTATGGPFGALVVRADRIIASGTNRVTSDLDPTAHAEIVAIRAACRILGTFSLAGCDIYSSCEPCPMCFAAIAWARADRIFFAATREDAAAAGFADAELYRELALPADRRAIPATLLLREEGVLPFQAWAQSPRKLPY